MNRFFRFFKCRKKPVLEKLPEFNQRTVDVAHFDDWRDPDFKKMWEELEVDEDKAPRVMKVCALIMENKARYETVVKGTKCPWWLIASYHYRESSLSFDGVLHNGDKIIGKGTKTYRVPKGRGPFESWEEAAKDAIEIKGYHKWVDWDIVSVIKRAELYNGRGYRYKGRGEYSPYLVAGTNKHDETGKYTHDGKYSNTAKEDQLGVMTIWKGLQDFYNIKIEQE